MDITLAQAVKRVRGRVGLTAIRKLPLASSCGRISAADVKALCSSPAFRRSLYDGYAIGRSLPESKTSRLHYRLAGTIAAGESRRRRLQRGEAWRVMTGAPVPQGAWKVIPQESCSSEGTMVVIAASIVTDGPPRIQPKGDDIRKGRRLLARGWRITPQHMLRLAEAGLEEVEVFSKPRVAVFCTGSELVGGPDRQTAGKTISSNRYLLTGLLQQSNCEVVDLGIVGDSLEALEEQLVRAEETGADAVISTGGLGPGKYDLVIEAFCRHGAEPLFSSLRLRPGKAALAGMLGSSLYFGLPGPPAAVQPLYHALVLPALRAMQAMAQPRPVNNSAYLAEELRLRRRGPLQLCPARLWRENGVCRARGLRRGESANGYLFCGADRKKFHRGELLPVLPLVGNSPL